MSEKCKHETIVEPVSPFIRRDGPISDYRGIRCATCDAVMELSALGISCSEIPVPLERKYWKEYKSAWSKNPICVTSGIDEPSKIEDNQKIVYRKYKRGNVWLYEDHNRKTLMLGVHGERKYWEDGFVEGTIGYIKQKVKLERTESFIVRRLSREYSYVDKDSRGRAFELAWSDAARRVNRDTVKAANEKVAA